MNSLHVSAIQDMNIWDIVCMQAQHRMPQFIIQLTLKRKQQNWSDQQKVSYCYVWPQIM